VLGAQVRLRSKTGERVVPVDGLFQDYYETSIEPGELITEVIVPAQPAGARTAYLKFLPRTADDYATTAVAAMATVQDGTVGSLKVCLGAAGPTPVHATAVEEALLGKTPTPQAIRDAAGAVAALVDPLDDFRGSSEYKRDMCVVFTRRALERVLL
jgi:carbon-monoxide dehydrogenase medium subunit